jgi:hypothetical protein
VHCALADVGEAALDQLGARTQAGMPYQPVDLGGFSEGQG